MLSWWNSKRQKKITLNFIIIWFINGMKSWSSLASGCLRRFSRTIGTKGKISFSIQTTIRCMYCRTPMWISCRCTGTVTAWMNICNNSTKTPSQPQFCMVCWLEKPLLARLKTYNTKILLYPYQALINSKIKKKRLKYPIKSSPKYLIHVSQTLYVAFRLCIHKQDKTSTHMLLHLYIHLVGY